MLVVGVTCTLASRSFYSVRLVTSRPSSMFRSPSLSCFLQPFEPRLPFLSIGYRSSSSSSMSPRFRHCPSYPSPDPRSHPFSGLMAPLWILGLISLSSPSPLFVMFSQSSSVPAQPGSISASPLSLSQHFFLRFRYLVSLQPNLLLHS